MIPALLRQHRTQRKGTLRFKIQSAVFRQIAPLGRERRGPRAESLPYRLAAHSARKMSDDAEMCHECNRIMTRKSRGWPDRLAKRAGQEMKQSERLLLVATDLKDAGRVSHRLALNFNDLNLRVDQFPEEPLEGPCVEVAEGHG